MYSSSAVAGRSTVGADHVQDEDAPCGCEGRGGEAEARVAERERSVRDGGSSGEIGHGAPYRSGIVPNHVARFGGERLRVGSEEERCQADGEGSDVLSERGDAAEADARR